MADTSIRSFQKVEAWHKLKRLQKERPMCQKLADSPHLQLGWKHEYARQVREIDAQIADLLSAGVTMPTRDEQEEWWHVKRERDHLNRMARFPYP